MKAAGRALAAPRAALVAGAVLTGLAAGGGPAAASLAVACQMDVELFCPEIDRESPRAVVEACLHRHREWLTESCRAVVDPGSVPSPGQVPEDPLFRACHRDFAKHCGHEAVRIEYARCVERSRPEFSPACRAELDALDSRTRP